MTEQKENVLYPVFLKLDKLDVLLVGAGNVGLEKLESLLGNSPYAAITVVAPYVKPEVKELLSAHPKTILLERAFEEKDLIGRDIVVLATDNKELHKHIQSILKDSNTLLNVADTPDLCDFYLGSIVKKGNLKIAISTNGQSPTAAKRLKAVLNETLPDELNELLDNLHILRNAISGDFAEKVKQLNALTKTLVLEQSLNNKNAN